MNKEEIIKEFDDRINHLSKVVDDIRNGKQDKYLKTKKEKDKTIYYQLGFIDAMKIAKDYLENYLK